VRGKEGRREEKENPSQLKERYGKKIRTPTTYIQDWGISSAELESLLRQV